MAGGEQVAQVVPGRVSQPWGVSRRLHSRHRRAARGLPGAPLAAYRRLLVPARRHADRRVLADWPASGGPLDTGPGCGVLPRTGMTSGIVRAAFRAHVA